MKKILSTIKEYGMISRGDRVLLAVSGGYDSTALLHLLSSLKGGLHIKIYAAHLNHKLRGKDSELDEKFVSGYVPEA